MKHDDPKRIIEKAARMHCLALPSHEGMCWIGKPQCCTLKRIKYDAQSLRSEKCPF